MKEYEVTSKSDYKHINEQTRQKEDIFMKTFSKRTQFLVAVALLLATAACAPLAPNTPLTTREQTTGIGAVTGGAGGAIIGSMTGSALAGGLIGMPLGALAGYYYGDKVGPQPGSDYARAPSLRSKVTFADTLFEFDKAEVRKDAMPIFNPLVSYLKDNPNSKVWIEGHTDNVGTGAYNMELATRRAEAVRDLLIKTGVDSKRIAAKGYGESQPIASNDTPEGRQANRRVEVEVF